MTIHVLREGRTLCGIWWISRPNELEGDRWVGGDAAAKATCSVCLAHAGLRQMVEAPAGQSLGPMVHTLGLEMIDRMRRDAEERARAAAGRMAPMPDERLAAIRSEVEAGDGNAADARELLAEVDRLREDNRIANEVGAEVMQDALVGWRRIEELEAHLDHIGGSCGFMMDTAALKVKLNEVEREVERLRAGAAVAEERLRSVARYADGLHFAGRLADEKVVRAALQPAEEGDLDLDLGLLAKLASGEGGHRTGALKRAGYLEWTVTEAGLAALAEERA